MAAFRIVSVKFSIFLKIPTLETILEIEGHRIINTLELLLMFFCLFNVSVPTGLLWRTVALAFCSGVGLVKLIGSYTNIHAHIKKHSVGKEFAGKGQQM